MVKKPQIAVGVPEAIVYTQLKLPSDIPAGASLSEELNRVISLEIQGEALEISEEYPTPILMAAFDVVHKISPEAVLRLKTGKRILLFDHWGAPVLRDEDIFDEFAKTAEHMQKTKTGGFLPELKLDLENIWRETEAGRNDDLSEVKNTLKKIEALIRPAMVTTLVGQAPALLFLMTQHLLQGKTGEIWYQEKLAGMPIRITRL